MHDRLGFLVFPAPLTKPCCRIAPWPVITLCSITVETVKQNLSRYKAPGRFICLLGVTFADLGRVVVPPVRELGAEQWRPAVFELGNGGDDLSGRLAFAEHLDQSISDLAHG